MALNTNQYGGLGGFLPSPVSHLNLNVTGIERNKEEIERLKAEANAYSNKMIEARERQAREARGLAKELADNKNWYVRNDEGGQLLVDNKPKPAEPVPERACSGKDLGKVNRNEPTKKRRPWVSKLGWYLFTTGLGSALIALAKLIWTSI